MRGIFQARTFVWWEIGLLKVCLLSLGILLGVYGADIVVRVMPLWWVLCSVTALYFIVRFFRE